MWFLSNVYTHTNWEYKILYTHIWHEQESTSEESEEEEEKKKWRLHERDRLRFCPLCSSHTVRHSFFMYAMLFITYIHDICGGRHKSIMCLTMFFFSRFLILWSPKYPCEITFTFYFVQSESLKLNEITEIGWINKRGREKDARVILEL